MSGVLDAVLYVGCHVAEIANRAFNHRRVGMAKSAFL